jgi:ribosomal protein L25 (general stress protein Ctc)
MALFLSSEIHQGDDLFSVQSRGKQCAFMSLSAVLTAQNIPLIDWSKTTLNNVLLQGYKMHLQALDNGFVVLEPGVEFLSVDNLPKVVSVTSCTNMFSYEICDSLIDTSNIPPVEHAKTTTTPVDPFDTQNNVELPMVVGQNSNSVPVVVRQNNNSPPVVVGQNSNSVPVVVRQNNNSLPVVVRQNNNSLPVVVRQNNNSPPVVVGQNSNSLAMVVRQNNNSLPMVVRQNNNSLPIVVELVEAGKITLNYPLQ